MLANPELAVLSPTSLFTTSTRAVSLMRKHSHRGLAPHVRSSTCHRPVGMPSDGVGTAVTQSCMTLGGCAGLGVAMPGTNSFPGNTAPATLWPQEQIAYNLGEECDSKGHSGQFALVAVLIRTRVVWRQSLRKPISQGLDISPSEASLWLCAGTGPSYTIPGPEGATSLPKCWTFQPQVEA